MKKTGSFLLAALMLLSLFAVSLSGCGLFNSVTPDEAKANLEAAGYTVTVLSGEEYTELDNPYFLTAAELETYLYAVKGSDEIHMFFFSSIDLASRNYDFMTAPGKLLGGQVNELVYFATKQARKDAKL